MTSGETRDLGAASIAAVAERVYRDEWSQVLSTVMRVTLDLQTAEDCVHDAFTQAIARWATDGVPSRPGAWLTTVAVRNALQIKRRAATARRRLPDLARLDDDPPIDPAVGSVFQHLPDDSLRLIFICCHPALSLEARLALTLRLVCGMDTAGIARAFLMQETAIQARITRAKKKIRDAGIEYRTPTPRELPERLDAVLDTVYLVYTSGHGAAYGDGATCPSLVDFATRLARTLTDLLPDAPEPRSLLALILLNEARAPARIDADGNFVPLAQQDRGRWDQEPAYEGTALLRSGIVAGARGRFTLMAAVSALHTEAPTWADTDWDQILALYDELERQWPSPVVSLNRAIALGYRDGPDAALRALVPLSDEPALSTYAYLPAARAEFLEQAGENAAAATAWREAALLADNAADARHLQRRAEDCSRPDPAPRRKEGTR